MPRDALGVYSLPSGTDAVDGEVIDASDYNGLNSDLEADANAPRPINAGGTGATTAGAARDNLGVTSEISDAVTTIEASIAAIEATAAANEAAIAANATAIAANTTFLKPIAAAVFDADGTATSSNNLTITKPNDGQYQCTFGVAEADTNYLVHVTSRYSIAGSINENYVQLISTTGFNIQTHSISTEGNNSQYVSFNVTVFRIV